MLKHVHYVCSCGSKEKKKLCQVPSLVSIQDDSPKKNRLGVSVQHSNIICINLTFVLVKLTKIFKNYNIALAITSHLWMNNYEPGDRTRSLMLILCFTLYKLIVVSFFFSIKLFLLRCEIRDKKKIYIIQFTWLKGGQYLNNIVTDEKFLLQVQWLVRHQFSEYLYISYIMPLVKRDKNRFIAKNTLTYF